MTNASTRDSSDGSRQAPLAIRLAFADAIARPGSRAMLITAENKNGGWTSVHDAVRSQSVYCVEVDDDIVAIDDDSENGEGTRHALGLLTDRHIEPVLVESGQRGRRHVFARVPEDDVRCEIVAECRRLGLDVRRRIRPALSPHRQGGTSKLLEPEGQLAALGRLARPTGIAGLSLRIRALIRHGDLRGRYRSNSEALQAIVNAAINVGASFDQVLYLLADPTNLGGKRLRDETRQGGHAGAVKYLRRSWVAAQHHSGDKPRQLKGPLARSAIARAVAGIHALPWGGQSGATDYSVFLALLDIANRVQSTQFQISHRELAERAGVNRVTASTSLTRIRDRRLLSILPAGRSEITTVCLSLCGFEPIQDAHTPPRKEIGSKLHVDHDVFRSLGVGKGPLRSYDAIRRGASTPGEIQQTTDSHRTTIRTHLIKLTAVGLIEQDSSGRLRVNTRVDLDSLARQISVDGVGRRQRERHIRERETFKQQQELAARIAPRVANVRKAASTNRIRRADSDITGNALERSTADQPVKPAGRRGLRIQRRVIRRHN